MQGLFWGVDKSVQQKILDITGFMVGNLPFKYLGVPLISRKLIVNLCRPLIDKITSKINHRTPKLKSYAGKQQLVKSVLFAITNYWMQVFPMPKCVIKHIEAVCRGFVWSGTAEITKKAHVSWDKMCDPNNEGGLNITTQRVEPGYFGQKLLWNIQSKADKLWVKLVNIYYLKNQDFLLWQPRADSYGLIKSLCACRETLFQTDYQPEVMQTGVYKTLKMYQSLRGEKHHVLWKKVFYKSLARPRAQFQLRLAPTERMSTKTILQKFGIITDLMCAFCSEQETLDHLYFGCRWTKDVWSHVLQWIGYHRTPDIWPHEKVWLTMEASKKGVEKADP